jgi:cytochrome P450
MSILNALDPKVHSRFRKAMDPGFTERAVRLQEPIIQSYVSLFIKQLDSLVATSDEGIVTDIVRWFGFVTFDLTGDLGFGEPFGCLESSEFHPWVSLIFSSLRAATYRASLRYYPSMDWLLRFAVPRSVMQKQLEHWQLTVDKINRRLSTEKQRTDLISMIQCDDEGIHGLTLPELQATASVIIVAGSETTVSVLTGAINYLVRNPAKFDRICLEIRARFSNEDDMSLAALKDLSYLNAVIQEGLRLCNPT